jgi:hypothetical protein
MANLGEGFNASDMPEGGGGDFAPLPAGEYTVSIAKAELCNTKKGDGQYIKLRLDVIGPSHSGRVLFSNLNIRNPNPKAEEIGRQQLGSVMRAIGVASLTDTDQLIGGKLSVKVVEKDDEYGKGNDVKAYKALAGSSAPAPSAMASAPAASKSAPPWAKK